MFAIIFRDLRTNLLIWTSLVSFSVSRFRDSSQYVLQCSRAKNRSRCAICLIRYAIVHCLPSSQGGLQVKTLPNRPIRIITYQLATIVSCLFFLYFFYFSSLFVLRSRQVFLRPKCRYISHEFFVILDCANDEAPLHSRCAFTIFFSFYLFIKSIKLICPQIFPQSFAYGTIKSNSAYRYLYYIGYAITLML